MEEIYKITNYERIKQMNVDEIVEFFTDVDDAPECLLCKMCMFCAKTHYSNGKFKFVQCCDEEYKCSDGFKKWLQADYDNYF